MSQSGGSQVGGCGSISQMTLHQYTTRPGPLRPSSDRLWQGPLEGGNLQRKKNINFFEVNFPFDPEAQSPIRGAIRGRGVHRWRTDGCSGTGGSKLGLAKPASELQQSGLRLSAHWEKHTA